MANGKGSGRRPAAVDDAKVASEWDRIFPTRRLGFKPWCEVCRSWHWIDQPHLAPPDSAE